MKNKNKRASSTRLKLCLNPNAKQVLEEVNLSLIRFRVPLNYPVESKPCKIPLALSKEKEVKLLRRV